MLINNIKSDAILSRFVKETCFENQVGTRIDENLDINRYVIIKIDDFYNSLNIEFRPASVDCLILQECSGGEYALTLIELKDIHTAQFFEIDNMIEKFETCLSDFMSVRFRNFFYRYYKKIDFYFVSNIEIHRRDLGLKMETLINRRFTFNNKKILIKPKIPNPVIKSCD